MSIHRRYLAIPTLLVLAFLAGGRSANATESDCENRAAAIIENAYPGAVWSDDSVAIDGATINPPDKYMMFRENHPLVCRVWPAHPDLILVAVPLMTGQSDDGNQGDLELLVIEAAGLKPRYRLRLPGLMVDDAMQIEGLTFDTARYQLAKGQIAFGIRIVTESSSRPDPWEQNALRLYAIEDKKLAPVMDGLAIAEERGEWDTNCAGEFESTQRSMAMQPTSHHGYSDIVVTEIHSSRTMDKDKNGECVEQATNSTKSTAQLIYNGSRYDIPESMRSLSADE